jgi:hypothetical protein
MSLGFFNAQQLTLPAMTEDEQAIKLPSILWLGRILVNSYYKEPEPVRRNPRTAG